MIKRDAWGNPSNPLFDLECWVPYAAVMFSGFIAGALVGVWFGLISESAIQCYLLPWR